jgi:hypothetical protein
MPLYGSLLRRAVARTPRPGVCCSNGRYPTSTFPPTPGHSLSPEPKPPHARPRETAGLVRLAGELTAALRVVIDSSPFAGLGPIEVARILGVDKTLASRLMSALRAGDALVALSLLPGVVPLRQFLTAARAHGAGQRAVQAAERRLRAFDHELQRAFGTRTRLDAALADALPEARRRHEDNARQAVYRGMAMLRGISVDLESITWVIHPGRKDPKRVDMLVLAAFVGIHRLRPTARYRVGAAHASTRPEGGARLLRKFCRPTDLEISVASEKDYTFYEISTGSVRRDAAADVYLSEILRDAASSVNPAKEKGVWHVGDAVFHATKRLELVLVIREDLWTGCEFAARAYDIAGRGPVVLPDPDREFDRLTLEPEMVRVPFDDHALRASHVPNYEEILRDQMAPLGWKLEGARGRPAFRKISCELAYPLYGSQLMLVQE